MQQHPPKFFFQSIMPSSYEVPLFLEQPGRDAVATALGTVEYWSKLYQTRDEKSTDQQNCWKRGDKT
jgi:hypothetical protein